VTEASERIKGWFPALADDNFRITSDQTERYNCVAWADGRDDRWWEPTSGGSGYYWPDDQSVPNTDTIEAAIALFRWLGYEECDIADAAPEEGWVKIAIYGDAEAFTHVARQEGGKWSSKLGPFEDILHDTLEVLAGAQYGRVVKIMKKRLEHG